MFSSHNLLHLPRTLSDHSPLLLTVGHNEVHHIFCFGLIIMIVFLLSEMLWTFMLILLLCIPFCIFQIEFIWVCLLGSPKVFAILIWILGPLKLASTLWNLRVLIILSMTMTVSILMFFIISIRLCSDKMLRNGLKELRLIGFKMVISVLPISTNVLELGNTLIISLTLWIIMETFLLIKSKSAKLLSITSPSFSRILIPLLLIIFCHALPDDLISISVVDYAFLTREVIKDEIFFYSKLLSPG